MSLRSEPIPDVPEETVRVARAAFPKGNLYLKMRDELGIFYDDADFAELFSTRGQPAFSPWRLALITVMQFAEGLSDRQAAEAVRARIDWKYALSLDLEDAGFDFSILSEFRSRLVENSRESVLLEKMLERFREKGWLKGRGRQRTDSTHILANVRHLNRLESVCEMLRAALNAVAKIAPEWLKRRVPADWFDRYDHRIEEYRLPKGKGKRNDYAALVGTDGIYLLSLIDSPDAPAEIQELKMIKLLRQMWNHQFELKDGKPQLKAAKDLAPANERFDSPYDAEARYGNKRATEWRGYKAHFTETCDEDCPFLICNVETTPATIPDLLMSRAIHDSLRKKKLLPATHLLDSGYIEAAFVAENARAEEPVEIMGPLRANVQWQAQKADGFALSDFAIDWETRQVTCPEGQTTKNWYLINPSCQL
jgi:Transposase and inactivated derivatives